MIKKSVFESLKASLEEAVAFESGSNTPVRTRTVQVSPLPVYKKTKIKSIREGLGLTQRNFAIVVGVSLKTVEAWESGKNIPQGPTQRFLELLDKGGTKFLTQYNLIQL